MKLSSSKIKRSLVFHEMELSSPKIKKFLIFQRMELSSLKFFLILEEETFRARKIKKTTLKNFLYFRK